MSVNQPRPVYWIGIVKSQDDFHNTIVDEFIDGRVNHGTQWGIFTPRSWHHYGIGQLGPGLGQRYEKQADGRWLKVEG